MKIKVIGGVLGIAVCLILFANTVPLSAAPLAGSITISPASAAPGSAVTVTGSGFSTASGVTYSLQVGTIATLSGTLTSGNFNSYFYVPPDIPNRVLN